MDKSLCHAVAGPSELLLFGCHTIITSWDFPNGEFTIVRRENCLSDMKRHSNNADINEEMFVDACMLAGNEFLPTLPQLESSPRKGASKPLAAIEMIMNMGRSGHSVCMNHQDDRRNRDANYLDKYRRARLAVKHHPIMTVAGKVEPLDAGSVPNDVHEFIGARLPDELYFYLSRGVIGPRPLNWRTSGEIVEVQPLDGGSSEEYKKLVSSKLNPLRVSVIALLSQPIHRFYQHKDLTLKCWFPESPTSSKNYTSVISMKDLPDVKAAVSKWNVKDDAIKEAISKHPVSCVMLSEFSLLMISPRNADC